MEAAFGQRRPRGTGSLFVMRDSAGRETWYGKWRVGRTQIKRRIGLKRIAATRAGLTRVQAESELRRLMGSVSAAPAGERVTVEEAGALLLKRLRLKGRKTATLQSYESLLRVHLVPRFGSRTLWPLKGCRCGPCRS